MSKEVGRGDNTKFWEAIWVTNLPLEDTKNYILSLYNNNRLSLEVGNRVIIIGC